VVTGRIVLLRLLTRIVRQCGASPDAVGVVVAVGCCCRCSCVPRYHNNLRRGRRPRRPLFGLTPMFASNYCTLLCGCVGCPRLSPRFARRDTRGWGCSNNAGNILALHQNILETTAERGGQSDELAATGRTYLSHNTAQARCGRASPNSGWHPTAVRGDIKPYPSFQPRDRR
jgi:hypothetical protein